MEANNKELRIFDNINKPEIREIDGKKYLIGYPVKWNQFSRSMGWGFKEKFKVGAFTDVLAQDFRANINYDTIALFNHNQNMILGRRSANTLEVGEDETGLYYRIELPNTTAGNDLIVSVERGDVRYSSFSFTAASDGVSWYSDPQEGEIREISKAKYLWDVSPVVDPAYSQSTVEVAQRSYDAWKQSKENVQKPVSRSWETEAMKREIEML